MDATFTLLYMFPKQTFTFSLQIIERSRICFFYVQQLICKCDFLIKSSAKILN